jgi:hypothetical protein
MKMGLKIIQNLNYPCIDSTNVALHNIYFSRPCIRLILYGVIVLFIGII